MVKLIGLSGSLRSASYNTALLRAAEAHCPDGVSLDVATLHGIPLYDGDLEKRDGIPDAVTALRRRIEAADGLIIFSPEYNNAIPGVLKNGVDWLSRRPDERPHVFQGLPVAITGATPGGFGTTLAQTAWLPIMRTLQTRQWFGGRLMVSHAPEAFDEDGRLKDAKLRERLQAFVSGFAEYAGAQA